MHRERTLPRSARILWLLLALGTLVSALSWLQALWALLQDPPWSAQWSMRDEHGLVSEGAFSLDVGGLEFQARWSQLVWLLGLVELASIGTLFISVAALRYRRGRGVIALLIVLSLALTWCIEAVSYRGCGDNREASPGCYLSPEGVEVDCGCDKTRSVSIRLFHTRAGQFSWVSVYKRSAMP